MINITIIDDFIPQKYQDEIEDFLLDSNLHSWYFQSDITLSNAHLRELDKKFPDNKTKRRPGFGSMLFDFAQRQGSPYHFLSPIIYCAAEKANLSIASITMIRSFLSMPVPINKEDKVDKPHVDSPYPHIVGLYYVNDSDGGTVIYKNDYNYITDNPNDVSQIDQSSLKIQQIINPKKGRLVFFDGKFYHSSTQPTVGPRCVINFHVHLTNE